MIFKCSARIHSISSNKQERKNIYFICIGTLSLLLIIDSRMARRRFCCLLMEILVNAVFMGWLFDIFKTSVTLIGFVSWLRLMLKIDIGAAVVDMRHI